MTASDDRHSDGQNFEVNLPAIERAVPEILVARGVRKPGSITTSVVRGTMATNPTTRSEALALMRQSK